MRNSILRVRPKIACHAPPDIASVSCSNIASGGLDGGLMGLDRLGRAWTGLDRLGWLCLGLPACLPSCPPACLPAQSCTSSHRWRQSTIVVPSPLRRREEPAWHQVGEQNKPMRVFTCELTRTLGASLRPRPSLQSAVYRVRSDLRAP